MSDHLGSSLRSAARRRCVWHYPLLLSVPLPLFPELLLRDLMGSQPVLTVEISVEWFICNAPHEKHVEISIVGVHLYTIFRSVDRPVRSEPVHGDVHCLHRFDLFVVRSPAEVSDGVRVDGRVPGLSGSSKSVSIVQTDGISDGRSTSLGKIPGTRSVVMELYLRKFMYKFFPRKKI